MNKLDKIYYLFILILFAYFVYTYYIKYYGKKSDELVTINNVDDYYYKNSLALNTLKKPKVWIHMPFSRNSRHWESFGSRTSENMNIPFVYMCLKSIIDNCGDKYNIIIYDDTNIVDILQEDSEFDDIDKLSGVLLNKFREVTKARILHKYGGVHLPCSLYLKECPNKIIKQNEFIACKIANEDIDNSNMDYVVSSKILGCKKGCPIMKEYISYLKELDYSAGKFSFETNEYLVNNAHLINEKYLGCVDINGDMVYLDKLFSENEIKLSSESFGLYINLNSLLKRRKYQWFLRMSMNQIYESREKFFLAKYIYTHL